MVLNDTVVNQDVENDLKEILKIQKEYDECMMNRPNGIYSFVELKKDRTVSDFYIEPNPNDDICLPDLQSYKTSLNLYIYKDQYGSGIFLLSKMPSKKELAMPDSVLSYKGSAYWWGIFDICGGGLFLATKKMKKNISSLALSAEEIETSQKIIRLVNAIYIPESPYVLNSYNGRLVE